MNRTPSPPHIVGGQARGEVGKMKKCTITVTAWNNGAQHRSGAGYGFVISPDDFNEFKGLKSVILRFETKINISESFRSKSCSELRSKEIGLWLRSHSKAPWKKNHPPKVSLELLKTKQGTILKK
jgi:hypothetical protein